MKDLNSYRMEQSIDSKSSVWTICRYRKIADICKLYGVYLIEDAAESLGATFDGKHTGTFGDLSV